MRRVGLVVAVGALLVALSSAVAVAAVRGGTNETDLLYGTGYADTIYALADDDGLVGYWGDDLLIGGSGNDWIYGGPGNDRIHGNDGVELLYGGPGNDVITVAGGRAKDYIDCGRGFDTVKKQPGSQAASTNVSTKDCERTIL